MDDDNTTLDGVETGSETPTTSQPDQTQQVEEWRNPDEIKRSLKGQRQLKREFEGFRDEVRGMREQLQAFINGVAPAKSDTKPQPAAEKSAAEYDVRTELLGEVNGLRAELAFQRRMAEIEVPLERSQKSIIESLYKAEKPNPDDLEDWLSEKVSAFKVTPAKVETKEPQRVETVQPPPPKQDARSSIPDDIRSIPVETWNSLKPEEQIAQYENWKRKRNLGQNPFAQRRKKQE